MAITKTNLGPNSASFTFDATENAASIMDALTAYIGTKGWSLFDSGTFNLGPVQANSKTSIFRALQDGSTSVYKYVGLSVTPTLIVLKIYQTWNEVTHTGTLDGSYYTVNSSSLTLFTGVVSGVGVDGNSVIIFANPKWLAFRTCSNANAYSYMYGAFEIKKEFGEAESIPTNIFMTNNTSANTPSSGRPLGYYGTTVSVTRSTYTPASASEFNTIGTPFGTPANVSSSNGADPITFLPDAPGACSMVATELVYVSIPKIAVIRGRILGLKLGYGNQVWNDMDTAMIKSDAEFFDTPNGTAIQYHIINSNAPQRVVGAIRYLIPA